MADCIEFLPLLCKVGGLTAVSVWKAVYSCNQTAVVADREQFLLQFHQVSETAAVSVKNLCAPDQTVVVDHGLQFLLECH